MCFGYQFRAPHFTSNEMFDVETDLKEVRVR
jgi:hypothetical protein